MELTNGFQDIFEKLRDLPCVSLPAFKETCLKMDYGKDSRGTFYNGRPPPIPFANSEIYQADISNWRILTSLDENSKTVYEVTFDVTDSNFCFKAGDTIGVIPQNSQVEVNRILDHLELISKADIPYTLNVERNQKGGKIPPHIPVESTLRHLLTYCVDIRTVMKKLFLLTLSKHTKDENERKILEYLCSKEGSGTYQTHILNRNICILDIFKDFKSCKPNIEVLMAYLPRLLPRPYSIVNTGLENSKIIKICFSIMDLGNKRKGLTTSWLENMILNNELDLESCLNKLSIMENSNKIPIYIRTNLKGISLPLNLENPLILIGAGTGVAPFIGFLEEIQLAKENNPNSNFGEVYLLFGCRHRNWDYIYKTELERFLSRRVLSKLFTAFSRDGSEIKYVQDSVMQNGESIIELIKNEATIFICGDLKAMALQVRETLVKCLMNYDNKTQDEADKLICDMEKEKRYYVDTWS